MPLPYPPIGPRTAHAERSGKGKLIGQNDTRLPHPGVLEKDHAQANIVGPIPDFSEGQAGAPFLKPLDQNAQDELNGESKLP